MKKPSKIPVYAINLPSNSKRRACIQEQFKDRHEFELRIFRGVKSKTGYLGFLKSTKKIIKQVIQSDYDFVIICSDDHVFTENYKKENLISCITAAGNAGAKVLLGGVERYGEVIPLTDHLLWVDHFVGSTFYVIYKSYFRELLELNFNSDIPGNTIISSSTSNKFLIYPFITMEGIFPKKKSGIQECPGELCDNFRLESISRLEKILYLKKYQNEKSLS